MALAICAPGVFTVVLSRVYESFLSFFFMIDQYDILQKLCLLNADVKYWKYSNNIIKLTKKFHECIIFFTGKKSEDFIKAKL